MVPRCPIVSRVRRFLVYGASRSQHPLAPFSTHSQGTSGTESSAAFWSVNFLRAVTLAAVWSALGVSFLATRAFPEPPPFFAPQSASQGYRFEFPRDHGAHPAYETEWWYYTGQLVTAGKKIFEDRSNFGFQLTFFRRWEHARGSSTEPWNQSYLAHGAISDLTAGAHYFSQRAARGGIGTAGADTDGLRVWTGRWEARQDGSHHTLEYSVERPGGHLEVRLTATSTSPPILHGEQGFSRKGNCLGCASMYYSQAPLQISGTVSSPEATIPVSGIGWMDHEFMTNSLQSDQVGWDWFSLTRQDGTQVMLFQVRGDKPSSGYVGGTVVHAGKVSTLGVGDFTLRPLRWWKSPRTGARYPIAWRVEIPTVKFAEEIEASIPDQEVVPGSDANSTALVIQGQLDERSPSKRSVPVYWEGAVATGDNQTIGYLEMTGYDRPIGGMF